MPRCAPKPTPAVLVALLVAVLGVAPGRAQVEAGTALRCLGTNGAATVVYAASLNAYPLTLSAWVRTTRVAASFDGIVSHYENSSFNGYSLAVYNGRLRGFYFRDSLNNWVYEGTLGMDGGFVADGLWHHVAMVIGPAGGALYVDGLVRATLPWTGVAGAPTQTAPLYLGRFSPSLPNYFQGDLDEVTLWNRALTGPELNHLKHRRHGGREEGLLGYWRFNEGTGGVATNAVPGGFLHATLAGTAWIPSTAPVSLQPVAGLGLKSDGLDDHMVTPHGADLNAYPLTVSAWVRTTQNTAAANAIVSKYGDSSLNGYSLFLYGGRVRGWYFRDGANYVWDGSLGVDGGFIADGEWHHVALVVSPARGQIFIDGVAANAGLNWVGTPGACSGTLPLQVGRYSTYPTTFQGQLDEVTVWSRALATNELQALKNLPVSGSETGLVAAWRFNEGTGLLAADLTGRGHTGLLTNGLAWTGSTAYLGDGTLHSVVAGGLPSLGRAYAVASIPGMEGFPAYGSGQAWRFYDYGAAPGAVGLVARLEAGLRVSSTGAAVPLTTATAQTNSLTLGAYLAAQAVPVSPAAGGTSFPGMWNLQPAGTNLDSVNRRHEAWLSLQYTLAGGTAVAAGTNATPPTPLLHFNGVLISGPVRSTLTAVDQANPTSTSSPPSHLRAQLQLPAGGAVVTAVPTVSFGGATFDVNLAVDGTATNLTGSFPLALAADQYLATQRIRYQPGSVTLGPTGAVAGGVRMVLPAGLGLGVSVTNRALFPFLTNTGPFLLGGNLELTAASVTFPATVFGTNQFYLCEDASPFLMVCDQVQWRVAAGELVVPTLNAVSFVRQAEDDALEAARASLVNATAANRISNDGFYRRLTPGAGGVTVRTDPGGAALLSVQVGFQPTPHFRPHLPYAGHGATANVPVSGGTLTLVNGAMALTNSYLTLSNAVPVSHARDCPADSACGSVAAIGPLTLPFRAAGDRLGFTPDGGLLAYGTVPPTNLVWGYAGGTNYAQRTADVQAGAYLMAGTAQRGASLDLMDGTGPGHLLLTGWGDASTNAAYVERPLTAAYRDGFANYPGLNFRAPATARSLVAGSSVGPYPLTARSKYYARWGGVSGIHEAASFPSSLTLYGYPFTFTTYRLSYLDSANQESRTDGAVVLPSPSGFTLGFERMAFTCRGNLDSARLPAGTGVKHLEYWDVDVQPLSVQFRPTSTDPCSLTTRYLVLGVQMQLPLVGQAFQGSLAFKPNGNLATLATKVEGVDGRFPLPANVSLQGPGASRWDVATAGPGYFNNWEAVPRPERGFFNVVGRLRLPFFEAAKVHLHVTPTSVGSPTVHVMGGWASEEGKAANQGWAEGGRHYFTDTAFDAEHDGWPARGAARVNSINDYRASTSARFRPRAQQDWLRVAAFDYPMEWDPLLRQFRGYGLAGVSLPVLDVDSKLKQVIPGKVDLDFAQDLRVDLPRIKVLDVVNDALDAVNAPLLTLGSALGGVLGTDLGRLTGGFRGLQDALRENADPFLRPVLDNRLASAANNLANTLSNTLANSMTRESFLAQVPVVVQGFPELSTALAALNGAATDAQSLLGKLDRTLADVTNTLGVLVQALAKDGAGNRPNIVSMLRSLGQAQGSSLGVAVDWASPLINQVVAELDPTLTVLDADLRQLQARFVQVRGQLGTGGDLRRALDAANLLGRTPCLQASGVAVSNHLAAVVTGVGDYFSADPARAQREIRERLLTAFLGSPITAGSQAAVRRFLGDANYQMEQLTGVLFDQVNRGIREAVERQGVNLGLADGVFAGMKGGGSLSSSLLAAKIRGSPTFQGESLRSIHLDADVQMNLPDALTFQAYLDVRELTSQVAAQGCLPPGGPSVEVTLGARDVPLDWSGVSTDPQRPLRVGVQARWTLQDGVVNGLGGSVEIKGRAGFRGGSLNDIGASLFVGRNEFYFAGKAGLTVVVLGIPVDGKAGIFAGKTCTLEPLLFVDPEAPKVLPDPLGFTGVYLQFGAGLALSDILRLDLGCVLDVNAGIETALFFQGGSGSLVVGGRQKMRLDAELLCLVKGSAEWAAFCRLDSAGRITVGGSAEFCAEVGYCPLCKDVCAGVQITGTLTDKGIDYSIDY